MIRLTAYMDKCFTLIAAYNWTSVHIILYLWSAKGTYILYRNTTLFVFKHLKAIYCVQKMVTMGSVWDWLRLAAGKIGPSTLRLSYSKENHPWGIHLGKWLFKMKDFPPCLLSCVHSVVGVLKFPSECVKYRFS